MALEYYDFKEKRFRAEVEITLCSFIVLKDWRASGDVESQIVFLKVNGIYLETVGVWISRMRSVTSSSRPFAC